MNIVTKVRRVRMVSDSVRRTLKKAAVELATEKAGESLDVG